MGRETVQWEGSIGYYEGLSCPPPPLHTPPHFCRDAAQSACVAIGAAICPHAVPLIMPMLYEAMGTGARNWQTKEASLKLLKQLAEVAPHQIAACLPEIVPTAGECLIDPREQVRGQEEGKGEGMQVGVYSPERSSGWSVVGSGRCQSRDALVDTSPSTVFCCPSWRVVLLHGLHVKEDHAWPPP